MPTLTHYPHCRPLLACFAVAVLFTVAPAHAAEGTDDLVPLRYNHPGLTVDLGVGLWAWPIPCDADDDGDFDLIVSCPDKPYNGVWLFENTTGDTAQTKFPVFKAPVRLSRTAHYVLPSYVDGKLRVLSPGFEYADFVRLGLEQKTRLDVPAKIHEPTGAAPGLRNKIRHNEWRYADYDGDGQLDLVVGIEDWSHYGWDDAWNARGEWTNGPLHGFVYWLRNGGTNDRPQYEEPRRVEAGGRPVDTYGCPTPNFADFDDDGDLDLLCGEFVDGFTYFENTGTRAEPNYAAGRELKAPDGVPLVMDLEMIVPIAFDWDRDGDLDLVVGDEDGRVALVENLGSLGDDRTPRFAPPVYFQQEAELLKCGALATPVGCDWDGDGDTDIVSGNTAGYIEWFENLSGPSVPRPKWARPQRLQAGGKVFRVMAGPNGSIQGPCEAKWGYTTLSVADWNADGLPDIVLNSIWGRVEWLKNVGTRTDPKLAAPEPIEVEWPDTPPKPRWTWWNPQGKQLATQWRTTPVVHDVTGDGLPDLVMLDAEGYLALYERKRHGDELVLLPPRRSLVDEQGQPLRLNAGEAGRSGRRKLCIADWNGDGRFDILLNSANADLLEQTGTADGKWVFKAAGSLAERNIEGHDVSPTVVDFDGNGVPDFLGGAEDGHFYFLANARAGGNTAAAAERPNIIVILVDDMGFADLGCYGSEIPTPHLDRLAAGGLRFTQFYNTGRCCPTRTALLTGLYPHQAGVGHMMEDDGLPGYRGFLNDHCLTLADVLAGAGYFTAATGKWHVGYRHPTARPMTRGFERFYGAEAGGFYFRPKGSSHIFLNAEEVFSADCPPPEGWYSTDAWTDNGIHFIDEALEAGKPFFLYLAHNAPHFPLQAPPETIAQFRGKYQNGWDALREKRHAKQIEQGVVEAGWPMSPRPEAVSDWDDVSGDERNRFDQIMAIYAACISRVDDSIGRLTQALDKRGVLDNTLILFMSDNGGNAESGPRGRLEGDEPGSADSTVFCGESWAVLQNTPFRRFKHYNHEGGIATPLIVHWPRGSAQSGGFCHQPGHVIDIMATCVDASGATYPQELAGREILPYEGRSLLPALANRPIERDALYWEHEGNAAIRVGDWKLVRLGRNGPWELYDLKADRTELNDLVDEKPALADQLADRWQAWAERAHVKPYPARQGKAKGKGKASGKAKAKKRANKATS